MSRVRVGRAASADVTTERELAERWAAVPRPPLKLEDGRPLQVIFPGVPTGGSGPDFRGAILDAGGDLLRGDVELHLLASGWRSHRHHLDPAYGAVVLHAVGYNNAGSHTTMHANGRLIPVLVLPPANAQGSFPPPFTPPCALRAARGLDAGEALDRLGLRRLRMKAAAVLPEVSAHGPGQALYARTLEILGGPANRAAFAAISRRLPLAVLLERCAEAAVARRLRFGAELRGAAIGLDFHRGGARPAASAEARLEGAAGLFTSWWPDGASPGWPASVSPSLPRGRALPAGLGRSAAIEAWVNGVLPVALASGAWPEAVCAAALAALPSPGTYGRLRPLEGWLGQQQRPFSTAARLQGGLLLHADYCTKGQCGRCPLSED